MNRFDPRVHQAHPPGYFLYILFGRILNVLFHDPNLSLVLLSIAASCGTVFLIYRMAELWFGSSEARFSSILYVVSPLGWFHGIVALTYGVEAFFSALIGYLCWRIHRDETWLIIPAAIALGVCAGVRPSSLVLLGPLFLYTLRLSTLRQALFAVTTLIVTLTAWFVPMIRAAGGFAAYKGALISLWRLVPGKNTVFNSSPANSIARAITVVLIYFLMMGVASFLPLLVLNKRQGPDWQKMLFTLVWIAPTLSFHIFIFLKFVNSGYLLLLIAPACLWLGRILAVWFLESKFANPVKLTVIGAGIIMNTVIFAVSPFYCSYRSVRRFEGELKEVRAQIARMGSPEDTLILGFDSHFLGFRHAGFYLPNYDVVEYPEAKLLEGTRIFAMHNGDTQLLNELPPKHFTKFIIFPLPEGNREYAEYANSIRKLVPANDLHVDRIGSHEYACGPIGDLNLLFPGTGEAKASVSSALHPLEQDVNTREHLDKSSQ